MQAGCLDDETVLRFFRSELGPPELADIDRHIDGCSGCRILLSSLATSEVNDAPFSVVGFTHPSAASWPSRASDARPAAAASLDNGSLLSGRFAVEELVGVGGMARVFRARDLRTGGRVAVKVTAGRDAEELDRFAREGMLLPQLSDPAIVRHIGGGVCPDGTPYLVMEWLEGEDLSSRLRRGPLPVEAAVAIGVRVATGLAAAHAAGVVHRDIKPSNIFLRGAEVGNATVIDFGVARAGLHEAASVLTREGALLGTLGYMAPEQAVGAKTADHRADIFSLGCVMHECLTGKRLFSGSHAVEVLANVLTQPVDPPSAATSDVPPAFDALVLRMLSRDPGARPQTCAAVVAALARIYDPVETPVQRAPPRPRPKEDAPSPWRLFGAAAGLGMLLGVAAFARSPRALAVSAVPGADLGRSVREGSSGTDAASGGPPATTDPQASSDGVLVTTRSAGRSDPVEARPLQAVASATRPSGTAPSSAKAAEGQRPPKVSAESDPFGTRRN